MNRFYLLGFVRNWGELPDFGDAPLYVMTDGFNGVVATSSPVEHFSSKQGFLETMSVFLESLCQVSVLFLPIQIGIRIRSEGDMAVLLQKYKQELDTAFERLADCQEYDFQIELGESKQGLAGQADQERALSSDLGLGLETGREYWTLVRKRREQQKRRAVVAHEAIVSVLSRLAPWVKDYKLEHDGEFIELSVLVQRPDAHFQHSLEHILMEESRFLIHSSGPWPPYHFIPFSLKQENYLVRETLSWAKRRDCNDR